MIFTDIHLKCLSYMRFMDSQTELYLAVLLCMSHWLKVLYTGYTSMINLLIFWYGYVARVAPKKWFPLLLTKLPHPLPCFSETFSILFSCLTDQCFSILFLSTSLPVSSGILISVHLFYKLSFYTTLISISEHCLLSSTIHLVPIFPLALPKSFQLHQST